MTERASTRRDVMRLAASGVLGGILGCRSTGCQSQPQQVLIIGAGVAGITAGQALRQMGHKVDILEARQRLGGRIHTDTSLGAPVDLGAMLLHGTQGNPLTPLLKRLQQPLYRVNYYDVHLHTHNQQSPTQDLVQLAIRTFRRGLKALPARHREASPFSLDQAFDLWFQEQPEAKHKAIAALMRHWILPTFGMKEGAALDDIATCGWVDADACTGGDHFLPNGYASIVTWLRKGLSIHQGQRAELVRLHKNHVTVQTNQRIWHADRVIITVPLGVLQAGHIRFAPQLPQDKREAIHGLGMGVMNKVVLRFARYQWPKEPLLLGYQGKEQGEFPLWVNMHRYVGAPLLMAVAGGTYGKAMEAMGDRDIIARCVSILREIIGSSLSAPTGYLITRWQRDPFACGAYSYVPFQSDASAYDAMAQPVEDRLFFAGEATHRRYPTTVHGAYLSGLREARRPCFQR